MSIVRFNALAKVVYDNQDPQPFSISNDMNFNNGSEFKINISSSQDIVISDGLVANPDFFIIKSSGPLKLRLISTSNTVTIAIDNFLILSGNMGNNEVHLINDGSNVVSANIFMYSKA